jgi:DTW domain-containing protein YfiP
MPSRLETIVWFHHKEWGLTSNTGGLLRLALGDDKCKLFMKGLPLHDNQLRMDFIDKHPNGTLLVVLWPSSGGNKKSTTIKSSNNTIASGMAITTPSITLEEIKEELKSPHGRRVVVMAVDGTWRNARRMVARLPSTIPRLDLPPDLVSSHFSTEESSSSSSSSSKSLLAPLRSKGPSQRQGVGDSLVCTAEAVALVLMELGLDVTDGKSILDLAKTKVNLVRRYRGHESKAK